jgi:lysine 2-monooxygenase
VATTRFTRREALRWAGAAAFAAALSPALLVAGGSTSTASTPEEELDVAIVGGGTSGLYAAYRLLTGTRTSGSPLSGSGHRIRVGLFEANYRIGGRIWSITPPGTPHLKAEVGGMRFLSTQEIVPRLIKALGLPTTPFSADNGDNFVYLRGTRFREPQYADPSVVPYHLPPNEQGQSPSQLLIEAIDKYVPNAANLTDAQWETVSKTATFDGTLLSDQGFWNLMQVQLSAEGYDLVSDGNGYSIQFDNWNAAAMMQIESADAGPNADYYTIVGGYERMPLTLAAMARSAGAAIHTRTTVRSISPATGGRVTLTVADSDGATMTVTARHVIAAVPYDPMMKIVERSPLLQGAEFVQTLSTVGSVPSCKLWYGFSEPWWTPLGVSGGSSITDLPIKRCWYFGTEGQQPGANPSNTNSLLMTYNDSSQSNYWAGYLDEAAFNGPPRPRTPPADMVSDAIQQISELHGVEVPQPYWTTFIDWRNLPYGHDFHYWQVHARPWEIIPYLRQPFDGTGLSVCGDCWSPSQNFAESGLVTTEGLMQSVFRLRPPPWLPEGVGIST